MVSHATPASVIAENVSRDECVEIFREVVESDLDVVMGAGHPLHDDGGNEVEPEEADAYRLVGGEETLRALTSEEGLGGLTSIGPRGLRGAGRGWGPARARGAHRAPAPRCGWAARGTTARASHRAWA